MPGLGPRQTRVATATIKQRTVPHPNKVGGRTEVRHFPYDMFSGPWFSWLACITPDVEKGPVASVGAINRVLRPSFECERSVVHSVTFLTRPPATAKTLPARGLTESVARTPKDHGSFACLTINVHDPGNSSFGGRKGPAG